MASYIKVGTLVSKAIPPFPSRPPPSLYVLKHRSNVSVALWALFLRHLVPLPTVQTHFDPSNGWVRQLRALACQRAALREAVAEGKAGLVKMSVQQVCMLPAENALLWCAVVPDAGNVVFASNSTYLGLLIATRGLCWRLRRIFQGKEQPCILWRTLYVA
jgi:hypothetical protein